MHFSTPRFRAMLLLIFLMALGIRVGITHMTVGLDSPPDAGANPDQLDYELFAHHLAQGKGFTTSTGEPTARRTPGASMMLLPPYLIFGRSYAAGRIWFCILSALTCIVVAYGSRQYFSRGVALLAAFAVAIYPGHFYYAMHFLSETPFALFVALAIAFTLAAMRQKRMSLDVAAGIAWGLAVLMRPNIVLAAPIALFMILFARGVRLPTARRWAVQAVMMALVISPWLVRNAVVMGTPSLTSIGGLGLFCTHNDRTFNDPDFYGGWVRASETQRILDIQLTGSEFEQDAQAKQIAMSYIAENADKIPGVVAEKLGRLLTPVADTSNVPVKIAFAVSWLIAAPLVLYGMWVAWRKHRAAACVLLIPILTTFATAVIYYGLIRFRDSIAPVFLVLAAIGVHDLMMKMYNKDSKPNQKPQATSQPHQYKRAA